MKIAVVTDDGMKISAHFGRAQKCAVYEVVDGRIVARELRDKPGHSHDHGHDHQHEHGGGRFQQMFAVMSDCQVVLARGMGEPAYEKLMLAGVRPILTDIVDVETAVQAVLDGTIVDNPRRLHHH